MTDKPNRYAVVGMKHIKSPDYNAHEMVMRAPHHQAVTLVREPGNRFDPCAVQVWIDGKRVGYISKDQNAVLSRFIDDNGCWWLPITAEMLAMDAEMPAGVGAAKAVTARIHKGNNEYPLVEIA